jgi:hypothetical protein
LFVSGLAPARKNGSSQTVPTITIHEDDAKYCSKVYEKPFPEQMPREIVLEIFAKYLSKEMITKAIAKVKKLTDDELIGRLPERLPVVVVKKMRHEFLSEEGFCAAN